MYIYICVCVYRMHIYVRTYVCMYVFMYVCMYVRMYVCTYVCMYVRVYCMHIYVRMYVCMHACMHGCMYVCMCMCICMSCMYVCIFYLSIDCVFILLIYLHTGSQQRRGAIFCRVRRWEMMPSFHQNKKRRGLRRAKSRNRNPRWWTSHSSW